VLSKEQSLPGADDDEAGTSGSRHLRKHAEDIYSLRLQGGAPLAWIHSKD
jgi:hypothetical protein